MTNGARAVYGERLRACLQSRQSRQCLDVCSRLFGQEPGGDFAVLALSLKQPWATLLVHGLKTVEVRKWPTARRGPVLIHAARVPDERAQAWAHVPPELRSAAQLLGGIIGAGTLNSCIPYRNAAAFAADFSRHLNEASWFEGPVLYGFSFTDLSVRPFRRFPGWMRFFPVPEDDGPVAEGLLFS
jgi:hypothetical protein